MYFDAFCLIFNEEGIVKGESLPTVAKKETDSGIFQRSLAEGHSGLQSGSWIFFPTPGGAQHTAAHRCHPSLAEAGSSESSQDLA